MLSFCAEPLAPEQFHGVLSGPCTQLGQKPSEWGVSFCLGAGGLGLSEGACDELAHRALCSSPGPVGVLAGTRSCPLNPARLASCFCQLLEKAQVEPFVSLVPGLGGQLLWGAVGYGIKMHVR